MLQMEITGGEPILLEMGMFMLGALESFFMSAQAARPQTGQKAAGKEEVAMWLARAVGEAGGEGAIVAKAQGATQGLALTRGGELIVATAGGMTRRRVEELLGGGGGGGAGAGLRVGDVVVEAEGYADSGGLMKLLQMVNTRVVPSQGVEEALGAVGGVGGGGLSATPGGGGAGSRHLDQGMVEVMRGKLETAASQGSLPSLRTAVGQSFAMALTELKVMCNPGSFCFLGGGGGRCNVLE